MPDRMDMTVGRMERAEEAFSSGQTKRFSMKRDLFLAVALSLSVHLGAALALISVPSPPFLLSKGAGHFEIAFFLSDAPASGGAATSTERKSSSTKVATFRRSEKAPEKPKESEIPPLRETVIVNIASSSASLQTDAVALGPAKVTSADGGTGAAAGLSKEGSTGPSGTTVAMPRYFDNQRPAYPMLARRNGYEGTIVLSAQVLASGNVGELRIKKSSGYEILDQSALEAVQHWRFDPGKRMGQPVTTWVEVPIRFVLTAQGHL
jgi:TonB family protein